MTQSFQSEFNYNRDLISPNTHSWDQYKVGAIQRPHAGNEHIVAADVVALMTGGNLVTGVRGAKDPMLLFSGGSLQFGGVESYRSTTGFDVTMVLEPDNADNTVGSNYQFTTWIGSEKSSFVHDFQLGFAGSKIRMYTEDEDGTPIRDELDDDTTIVNGAKYLIQAFAGPSGGSNTQGIKAIRSWKTNGSITDFTVSNNDGSVGDNLLIQNIGCSKFAGLRKVTGRISEVYIKSGLLSNFERDILATNMGKRHRVYDFGTMHYPGYSNDPHMNKDAFVFSLTRANFEYDGPLVRIKRSSDNKEADVFCSDSAVPGQDFYDGAEPRISENSRVLTEDGYGETLTGFVGNNDALVQVWYDQGYVRSHTPMYGASINFKSENSEFFGADYGAFVQPQGINNLKSTINISYMEDAESIKTLLSGVQHSTTGSFTGQMAFTQADKTFDFAAVKNKVLYNLDQRNFYNGFKGSQITNYSIDNISKDVYKVNLTLMNNRISPFLNKGFGPLKQRGLNDSSAGGSGPGKQGSLYPVLATSSFTFTNEYQVYSGDVNDNIFDNYFYGVKTQQRGATTAAGLSGALSFTGLTMSDSLTRTFFWTPDSSTSINNDLTYKTNQFGGSFHQSLNVSRHTNNLRKIDLTFSHRKDDEAYAMLHFLMSHLGYKTFVYEYDAQFTKQKRVFYCDEWNHFFDYMNSNTITATFTEVVNPVVPITKNTIG